MEQPSEDSQSKQQQAYWGEKTEFKVHQTRSESTFPPLPALKAAQHPEAGPHPSPKT